MFGKTTIIIGAAAGYVLGARAGRERYDEIVEQANKLWGNPKVQETVSGAQDVVKTQAKKQTSAVKEKVGSSEPDTASKPSNASASTPSTTAKPPAPASGTVSGQASTDTSGAPKPGSPA